MNKSIHRVLPILTIGLGIAFNAIVGHIAILNVNNTDALIVLVAMTVPAASMYVSGGRLVLFVYLGVFAGIAVASAWGGNQGLAVGSCSIMALAVLTALLRIAWKTDA